MGSGCLLTTGLLCFMIGVHSDVHRLVKLPEGDIRGTYLPVDGQDDSLVFYGIPYAAPPVGDLRFRAPQPPNPWQDQRDASTIAPACPQKGSAINFIANMLGLPSVEFTQSEDCLTLDVYTKSLSGKRPVMVFIHGGSFVTGSSTMFYDFRAYASLEDIVVVSVQYRIGALGWMSTGDDALPGNLGFQDQIKALEWVQTNVALFGGNPAQVTIFGESAGAFSVSLHLVSPKSNGLFHKAIIQSGSAMIFPNFPSRIMANQLVECLGCPSDNSSAMMDCIKTQPAANFIDIQMLKNCEDKQSVHQAVVDGNFVPDDPEKLFRAGEFNKDVDVMLGNAFTEGHLLATIVLPNFDTEDFSLKAFKDLVSFELSTIVPQLPLYLRDAQVEEVLKVYVKGESREMLATAVSEFFGDRWILWSTYALAVELSEFSHASTYFYELRHRPSLSNRPEYVGADHGDDLLLMQGLHITGEIGQSRVESTADDRATAKAMFEAWSNFARNGDPNGIGTVPSWPMFDTENSPYMVFQSEPHVELHYKAERIKLWSETLPALAKSTIKDTVVGPVARTEYGRVRGKVVSLNDPTNFAYAFLGVPYTAPPVGKLRFQPPAAMKPWRGIRKAINIGNFCPQFLNMMKHILGEMGLPLHMLPLESYSEDCLTLNIYTPSLTGKRTVMVFIHGGALTSGGSGLSDMRAYSIEHDVVGVAIQYRIGTLGFMSSGDGVIKGNMGFLDQVEALRWVQRNIANFGGNPADVTIFGESAGSWSVSLHLVSPLSRGLFKRAIMHSGSMVGMNYFSPPMDVTATRLRLINDLGCPNTTSEEALSCLQDLPVSSILDPKGTGFQDNTLFWPIVLDNKCFTGSPVEMMDRGEFNKDVDLIAGFTQVEGHMLLNIVFPAANNPEMNMTEFKEIASMALPAFTSRNDKTEEIVEAATHVYVKNTDDDHNLPYILAKMCGDALITHTTYMTAMKFAALSAQRTFLYDFHLRPFFSTKPKFITADHGDDLFFTFGLTKLADALGIPCAIGQEKTEYIRQEDMVIQLWTSFAKTGIPSADGAPTWLELEEGGAFLKIAQHPELLHNYEEEQMKFWLETVPAIYAAEKRDEL